MGISSFYGLQTSLRGLLAQQRSLDVTSHNIANASTVGYSRQQAVLGAAPALSVPAGALQAGSGAKLGAGVDVLAYRRLRDTFLDLQYRGQNTTLGEQKTRSAALQNVETGLAEPTDDGLAAQLSAFWDAWSAVSNAPESPAARQALVAQASALGGAFASVDRSLKAVSDQADGEYAALIGPNGKVDEIARELAGLNDAIGSSVTAGETPNDLMDRRDLLLDQLSEYGQVSISDGSQAGSIVVTFGNAATPLVDNRTVTLPTSLTNPGGRLGALQQLGGPSGQVAGYRAQLSTVAKTLADTVNAIHATGNAGTAGPFFTYTAGSAASSLTVAVSAAGIATSSGAAAGANDLSRQIAALRGGGADSSYASFVAKLGTDSRAAQRLEANAEALAGSVDDRRQGVSGVALDEEMTNLIRFQRAYQASSRAMSTMDEMLDVLINRTGRVGL